MDSALPTEPISLALPKENVKFYNKNILTIGLLNIAEQVQEDGSVGKVGLPAWQA